MNSSIIARLAELAELGKHERGIARGFATPQERAARQRFAAWAREDGYSLRQDSVGNLFARRAGTMENAAPILAGSHLDTVPTGGAYDGAYGAVGALCALKLLDGLEIETRRPVEAVAWAGEEGSRFPLGCLGSSVFSGIWTTEAALDLCDENGTSVRDALDDPRAGFLDGVERRDAREAVAYLELHVEQGPVLESSGIPLGVVTAIAGQRRYRITVDGRSGHAGTVPMHSRADALCAASELILAVEAAARAQTAAVATVGRATIEPGGTNVIPSRVSFSLDVRSSEESAVGRIESELEASAGGQRRKRAVEVKIERLETRAPAPMNERMRQAVYRAVQSLGHRAIDISSGAGHDAMCLSHVVPAAMIFVPSIGGCSHVAEEKTAEADLELGVQVLAKALVEADGMLEAN